MSASEIIKEMPKLSDAEPRAVYDNLRELSKSDEHRGKSSMTSVRVLNLRLSSRKARAEGSEPLDLERL